MNDQQRKELLQKIADLCGEHSVAFACVLEFEVSEEEETPWQDTVVAHTWRGRFTNVIGLVERLRTQLDKDDRGMPNIDVDDEDDDGDDWKHGAGVPK